MNTMLLKETKKRLGELRTEWREASLERKKVIEVQAMPLKFLQRRLEKDESRYDLVQQTML